MTWLQRYRVRHYVQNSIWVWPAVAMVAAIFAVRVVHWVEETVGWGTSMNTETARTVLGALAGAMFTFIVFLCSSLLLVVQLASAQLTPRVIGTMFSDRVIKLSLAIFVFSFTFALSAMVRVTTSVPLLLTHIAAYGCVLSIGVFLYLIDHVGKKLRPSAVFESVAVQAHNVINHVYPRRLSDQQESIGDAGGGQDAVPKRTVTSTSGGVVLAFDVAGLVALATRHDCVIELAPQVGNFVAPGDPLFYVRGGSGLSDAALLGSIALGAERTMEQDPAFAFRMIVDIAAKGLSPAINDPTTAVLAIDRLHHLLRHVGRRRLDDRSLRDASGRIRLTFRTPDWEDFVVLAVTEIRQFGGASVQIARRLRAMLENLIATLPPLRAEALRRELLLLQRSTERCFQEAEDRVLAEQGDSQGVGGANASNGRADERRQ
jgi:uncharacterized membrane protein